MASRVVLASVLGGVLKLLHPFMPFITEELWQKIPKAAGQQSPHVMVGAWPVFHHKWSDAKAEKDMGTIQEVITKLRTIRSEMGIPPAQAIEVRVRTENEALGSLLNSHKIVFEFLNTKVSKLDIAPKTARPHASAAIIVAGADMYVPLEGIIDFAKEKKRLEKELVDLREDAARLTKKLANQDFLSNAPPEEISKAQNRLKESQERAERLEENIAVLS